VSGASAWSTVVAWRWSVLTVIVLTGLLATVTRIGSDWDWVVAMGDHIRRTRSVPDHVPFAAAPTQGWHDVPVLGQLVASVLHQAGTTGVVIAHLALVVLSWCILLVGTRREGGRDAGSAVLLALVVLGSLTSWGLVRLQTYSLPLFAVLLVLVVRQSRRPDRAVWLAPPLVVLWGNLHGAVLLGVCVLGAYLLLGRLRARPQETVAVGVASLVALLVTPQGLDTVAYYVSVFDNAAADRGEGLWAAPDLGQPFDVVMLLVAALMTGLVLRHRRQAWEYVAVIGLVVATLDSARHGIWLLCLLLALAGRRPADAAPEGPVVSARAPLALTAVAVAAVAVPLVLARGDAMAGADPSVVAAVAERAGDAVVLAPAPLVESLAVAGVTVWAGNPLDAFDRPVQEAYLDFLAGRAGMRLAIDASDVVVTEDGTVEAERVEAVLAAAGAFRATSCGEGWTCHVRR